LAGHTANNRLRALALKPAPVQATYLGYPATTGLPAMDWRLTDAVTEPEGMSEQFYTERLYRLPNSLWCYQPFADMGEVSPLPALANGYVTFGSFNNFSKIGPRVVDLWARVLNAVPDSRLLMLTVPSGTTQSDLLGRFDSLGIARDRIELHDKLPRPTYNAMFARADIALDPFPCNGGTTTCDALWMGLPVVALIGQRFLSRAAYSVLNAAGCGELAASDEAGYVELCAQLASDLGELATRRAEMRRLMSTSPLMDAEQFACDIEAAYRAMWVAWCETAPAP
jgi:predicted O-linked N-acetylglucosamine transferase (SPINDLY family)